MFKQQIMGVIQLSLPVIIIYSIYPALVIDPRGQLFLALLLGFYMWYLHKVQHDALIKSLIYVPTGDHKQAFEELIRACKVAPETIALRYAYTGGQLAMAVGRTIIVDPLTSTLWADDGEAIKVKDIFESAIHGTLSIVQKTRITGFREQMSAGAERFIFKHELGHVVDNFAWKKLWTIFILGTFAAYCGIAAGVAGLRFGGFGAIVIGIFVGGLVDIVAGYLSNAFFKAAAEKRADFFAVQHSPYRDVEEAADFFVKHQEIIDLHKEQDTFLNKLPSIIISGHMHGKKRAIYLRRLVEQKLKE